MAAAAGSPKDSISELVRKLMTLDESERKSQLASLSEYTKVKEVKAEEPAWIEGRSCSKNKELKMASPASHGSGSTGTGKVGSGSGSGTGSGSGSGSGDEAASAENSCDDSSGKEAGWPQLPPGLPQPRKVAPPPVLSQDPIWKTEPASEGVKQPQEAFALPTEFAEVPGMETDLHNSLVKALMNLSGSLPPQAAAVAQQLMSLTEGGKPAESGRQRMQALQSFRQHLEWQQEESVQKITRILQAQRDEQPTMPMPYGQMDANAHQQYGGLQHGQMYVGPQSLADYSSEAWQYGPASVVPHFSLPGAFEAGQRGFARGGLPPRGPRPLRQHGTGLAPRTKTQVPPGLVGRGTKPAAGARLTASGAQGAAQETGSEFTLRTHLRELQKVELSRIVLIRKISKLGFDSAPILETHYSHFGKVEKVLVAHSHVKPQHCGQGTRLRPSGLGFVVMSQPSEVEAILAAGENQIVHGVRVQVRHFERRGAKDCQDFDEDDEEQEQAP